MKRLEKYRIQTTSFSYPQRMSILLDAREVAEIYVRDGEMELRGPNYASDHSDVIWREDIIGWGEFDASERDHYIHEAIRRVDILADPKGRFGELDKDEPVPHIAAIENQAAPDSGPDL